MKLKIEGLAKSFGTHRVLDSIQLEVDCIQTLALIGPSGSGKSTLLRILAGLEYPETGSIMLDDEPIPLSGPGQIRHRRSVGTVFQAFNLFPHLTALENILLPLVHAHGQTVSQARETAEKYLRRFQLLDHAHKKPAALSGGQRQRIAIARAVAVQPKILLLDEPTSALDPEMTAEVLELIEELKTEGRDFILVTHQMGFARRVADHILFLVDGKILESGSPEQVFDQPATAACRQFLSCILKY